MRVLNSPPKVVIAILMVASLVASCTPDLPTSTSSIDPSYARPTSSAYATSLLSVLAGDNSSRANGVNDAGEVVGYSCCSQQSRAFVTLGGVTTALAGTSAQALAISNGATRYVVGWAGGPSLPVRWTISGNTPGQPENLSIGTGTWGVALGVNDAGEAVGHASNTAAMWDAAGGLTLVQAPDGYTRGEGRDINNTGDAVFVFFRSDPVWAQTAGSYLRLANNVLISLPPLPGDVLSYVNSVSDADAGELRIAGSSYTDQSSSRALQWTVDIALEQIVATAVRPEASHSVAIADDGAVAGFIEGPTSSLKSDAFRWAGTSFLKLAAPKGWKLGKAWAISPNGMLVAGEVMNQSRRAILWTMPSQ